MYRVLAALCVGLVVLGAPTARADIVLNANWNWDDTFSNVTWGVVTDTEPGQAWFLPGAERQSLTPGFTVSPLDYPVASSTLWNERWALTGIAGNSGNPDIPATTELKLGNEAITGSTATIEFTVNYSGDTALDYSDLAVTGWNYSTSTAPTFDSASSTSLYTAATGQGLINAYYDFSSPMQWEDFQILFPAGSSDYAYKLNVNKVMTVVPEPGTLALLMLGLPFAGLMWRRKKLA